MYIITPNAAQISRTAWRDLRERPSIDGKPNVTTRWWSVIVHPVSEDAALNVDPEEAFTVKPNGHGDDLMPLLNIPSQAEKDAGRQGIVSARGRNIQVKSLLPASITAASKTRQEMETDGWFDE